MESYYTSDARQILAEIQYERQERRERNKTALEAGAKIGTQAASAVSREYGTQAEELLAQRTTGGKEMYEMNPEYLQKKWYKKPFTKPQNRVRLTEKGAAFKKNQARLTNLNQQAPTGGGGHLHDSERLKKIEEYYQATQTGGKVTPGPVDLVKRSPAVDKLITNNPPTPDVLSSAVRTSDASSVNQTAIQSLDAAKGAKLSEGAADAYLKAAGSAKEGLDATQIAAATAEGGGVVSAGTQTGSKLGQAAGLGAKALGTAGVAYEGYGAAKALEEEDYGQAASSGAAAAGLAMMTFSPEPTTKGIGALVYGGSKLYDYLR